MTARIDLIERFLSYLFQPLASFIRGLWHSPTDTVIDAAVATGTFIQDHPLTCVAIMGAGMYAHKRGALKFEKWGVSTNLDLDTGHGGIHAHNSLWIGKK